MKKEINMRKKFKKKEQGSLWMYSDSDRIITDPNGSYTGVNIENPFEKPTQDVDDL